MRSLNLPTFVERLVRSGREDCRSLAYAALTHLRVLASSRDLVDRDAADRRLLVLLTELEAHEQAAQPPEEPPAGTKDLRLFGIVERVLSVQPALATDTGIERLFRVVEGALGRRPPRPWRALVQHLGADERAAVESFAALQGAILMMAHAIVEAQGPTRNSTERATLETYVRGGL